MKMYALKTPAGELDMKYSGALAWKVKSLASEKIGMPWGRNSTVLVPRGTDFNRRKAHHKYRRFFREISRGFCEVRIMKICMNCQSPIKACECEVSTVTERRCPIQQIRFVLESYRCLLEDCTAGKMPDVIDYDDMEKDRAEALALLPALEWQPIETVRKNGLMTVDLWVSGKWNFRIADAKWQDGCWQTYRLDNSGGYGELDWVPIDESIIPDITHWRYYPQPPASKEGA
jgi:hypothetical protein